MAYRLTGVPSEEVSFASVNRRKGVSLPMTAPRLQRLSHSSIDDPLARVVPGGSLTVRLAHAHIMKLQKSRPMFLPFGHPASAVASIMDIGATIEPMAVAATG